MAGYSYVPDVADIQFVLRTQLQATARLAATGAYPDLDADTLDAVIESAAQVATEVLSPINRVGDEAGATFDGNGNVTTAPGFRDAWRAIADGGWVCVSAPPEHGGMGLPHVVHGVTNELFFGAASAFMMYPGLTSACANMMMQFAPPLHPEVVLGKLVSGAWAGTMCLTEAGAGSDVGANRCKATPTDEPGVYLLEGEKIFISGGDHDLTENILHVVLARTPDAPAGTKGLSIFLVPKFLFDAEGNLGERNGAFVGNIEHKMGINGSATCTLLLGDRQPCRAWRIGAEGQGMSIMFHMMNEARLGVAVQGTGIAANAYEAALAYTRDRRQGAPVRAFGDAAAPRVPIAAHPDVRRMLLTQKCQVEAMRSLCARLGLLADLAQHGPEAEREGHRERLDLLTPIAKAHCTDVGFECAVLALQCHGGYGFIREYPVEQFVRDSKINSIYEGTNGIQAMDLLGRKMRMKGGMVFMSWMQDGLAACEAARGEGLAAEAGAIDKALQQVGATAMFLGELGGQGKIDHAMLHATPFLRMMGTVVLALESLDQARAAKAAIAASSETPLLRGKLANIRFYVHNILPAATALGKGIQSDDGAALDEALFA
jgi:hypothetical protein